MHPCPLVRHGMMQWKEVEKAVIGGECFAMVSHLLDVELPLLLHIEKGKDAFDGTPMDNICASSPAATGNIWLISDKAWRCFPETNCSFRTKFEALDG